MIFHKLEQGFPGNSAVKNLPTSQETWVQSLDQEDPLEKGMAPYSGILGWRIPQTEEPGGLYSMGSQSQIQLSSQHMHGYQEG